MLRSIKALKYLLPFGVYLGSWTSFHGHGWQIFLPLIYAFVVIPLLELLIQPDGSNMDEAAEALAKKDRIYDLFLYLVIPLQYIALSWFLSNITDPQLLWWEKAGRVGVMGLMCGVFGINVGHELGHRHRWYEQWMAKALLLTSLYTHFYIEHNRGHHKHVSTPGDPSSAPYGMSLYRFWWRSIKGVYLGAWHISNVEMRKKGFPALHLRNEMLQLQMLSLLFIVMLGLVFGWNTLPYFLASAVIGFLLLETVNYIEHYGLQRKATEPGKFERAQPNHSWNSNHILGRLMLFELSRHSDHHYLASRPYQVLRHHDHAPQLPTGYPGSMILAAIPPLWFRIMDRQLKTYHML